MTADTALGADVPFLGLHYFDERQAGLFFGRDEQLRDMLAKLTGARLVTVIGSSGTGKSSLVRAAVFPALREGFLTDLHPRWRIVTMFPGSSPIANLAAALETEFKSTGIEVTLRRSRRRSSAGSARTRTCWSSSISSRRSSATRGSPPIARPRPTKRRPSCRCSSKQRRRPNRPSTRS
jgi:hypothetical protein